MHPFSYTRVNSVREALDAGRRGGRYLAGGTTLVDLMRETVETPDTVVDISALPLTEITATAGGGIRIGALVPMAEATADPKLNSLFPVAAQALRGASAQLRNMATVGGNIMQRTRCTYFRDVTADCNKREPGSGCAALNGYNRGHAILGGSDHCVAVHASDFAVALTALEGSVHLQAPDGKKRSLPFADFLLRPGSTPHREQSILQGELITAVEIPAYPRPLKSAYLKIRDRQSYSFGLASAAVALHVRGGVIREAKVAAGGVATVPWKLSAVEQALIGERPSDRLWAEAAGHAADGARPLRHNRFKVELLRRTVERQLRTVGEME
ncbi:FAD binding domain-containing protein [Streptomyces turgidiscabies]|uniref:FAD binding domain in molybdopterin dehydrogenase n=1 Tax=Streptomyces turgidiscabies (strain Car8) TaxID=698760 RepID=L7F8M1_STRT8|nr:xanthine dehydrogenase family protein subunit M [Streptomyces turgidiscabies]ELP67562.1 FAD binding domain in molybdopterin dehydrogenase [Streptomyces turgidiscabies Car8]MDX3496635.1 xanthine dehydrogenase family protein subunit M [Streptomyces turgidiscabies]GAQ72832.1 4-hydroxybenzoyl-CoA reductase subunit beta [Streptomyces turgidiscabies]